MYSRWTSSPTSIKEEKMGQLTDLSSLPPPSNASPYPPPAPFPGEPLPFSTPPTTSTDILYDSMSQAYPVLSSSIGRHFQLFFLSVPLYCSSHCLAFLVATFPG